MDGTVQEGRDSSRKGLHGCFTGEQGLYIYDNGTAGRNAIGQICLLPEISAVLNQSDAVCIPKNYDLEKIREQELVKIRELTGVSLSLQ